MATIVILEEDRVATLMRVKDNAAKCFHATHNTKLKKESKLEDYSHLFWQIQLFKSLLEERNVTQSDIKAFNALICLLYL